MKYILFLTILLFVLIIFFNSYKKESFQTNNTNKWSPDLIRRFIEYQNTVNNNVNQFNIDILQQQASPQEAEEYLKNGYWTWSDELKQLYIESIWSSPLIKIDPKIALEYAMSVYNKNAVTQLLAWNTKEGNFLLYGITDNKNNEYKCSNDNNSFLQKITNKTSKTNIKSEDIPKEIPGFNFVKSPCNPCAVFNSPRDFTCPFKIRVSPNDNNSISQPWKLLWGLS